jgi:hypothetical protein
MRERGKGRGERINNKKKSLTKLLQKAFCNLEELYITGWA